MESLSGSVERITYYNEENGYSVLRLRADQEHLPGENREGLVTVTGSLPELAPGEYIKLNGAWTNHPKHGLQFDAQQIEQALPATLDGLRRYLGSGLLAGIGPVLADRIVDHFGEDTLDVIENHPRRLRQVPDIGPKRSTQIIAAWEEQKQIKEIMLFLHSHGLTTNLAIKIYKHYGGDALRVVQENPYQLARDLFGVGFKTADKIAQSMGLPHDHPTRIEAGVVFALEESTYEGNTFTPREEMLDQAAELLVVERAEIEPAIESLKEVGLVITDTIPIGDDDPQPENAIYLTPYYYAEVGAANRLRELNNALPTRLSDIPPALTPLTGNLSEQQEEAIRTALSQPVSILTGGPGTGKTTALQALIGAVEAAGKRYALASPTGRAAKRLSEATGRPASTLHRLLDFSPTRGFVYNAENPLPLDLLVVDEVSMLDILLANSMLKALEPGTHLVMVGDIDQLPAVGAGDVLRDLIDSGTIPVTRLTQIFRQAEESHIITNAHLINQGKAPEFPKDSTDFFRFPASEPEEAARWVEELVTERIPERFGLDPLHDIQVLVPMYRGPAGITALNERLQNALNPGGALKPERRLFGQTFRPGDKVMQIKNDYDKQVFNGDIGFIRDISAENNTLTVNFDERPVDYAFSEADQLVLAYAVSVHKSQGSEFPAIILPLLTHHYMMLQRNLLYTAITRARKLCVLVSNMKAIHIAVKNNQVAERWTGLDWRVQENRI